MNPTTDRPHRSAHPARGVPPAARGRRAAAFLLESVEQGRLGRYSFVGSRLAARLASPRPRRCGEPVVGYLGYDHAAQLEPTVPLPGPTGPPCPRAASSSPTRSSASTTRTASRRCSAATRRRRSAPRRPAAAAAAQRTGCAGTIRRLPVAARATSAASAREGAHPRGRRVPDRALAARRAADPAVRARALPHAPPHQPVAVPLPARARRPRARRLLARDARQARGPPRRAEPDRRHDAPRRGRRRAAARLREGPRRARDARRPRPQRPLARLPARDGPGRAVPRAGALLARHAPRLGGRRRAARGRDAVRPAARVLPGRHRLRRAEGARDADHLGARGLPARAVRGRRRLRAAGRRARHVHRDPHGRPARRASRTCRRARGIVADSDPAGRARGVPAQARGARGRDRRWRRRSV